MMIKENNNVCIRCGKCCHYLYDNKLKKCRFLLRIGKIYHCRIYHKRLGVVIDSLPNGKKIHCIRREDFPFDIIGCSYNSGKEVLR